MQSDFFKDIYKSISIPIVVCENCDEMPVIFANTEALLLLNPLLIVENIDTPDAAQIFLHQLLKFSEKSEQNNIFQMLSDTGSLSQQFTMLLSPADELIPVTLTSNTVSHNGSEYIVFYIYRAETDGISGIRSNNDVLGTILNISCHSTDVDCAINAILSRIGEHISVSRVYIFEDLLNEYTRNTYEWCAPGIEPAIQDLQNLRKDEYSYDTLVNSGLYITGDVSVLSEKDRVILEPQGIKALAILALYDQDTPIGYIGYDDCQNTREWSHEELTLLNGVSSIVSSLIIRRNAETNIKISREILQTISDNIDSAIYVNDIKTYELKFVNKKISEYFGLAPEELIGKKCWEVLQKDMDGPCPFCPIPELMEQGSAVVEWEHQNLITGGWFWLKDSIIQWVDGSAAHFEVAIDITMRKRYEEQLRRYASTDALTGVYSREWGIKMLESEHRKLHVSGPPISLCFIDLDGLKHANDSFGHNVGDKMILDISNAICNRIRKNVDMVCRWGGDEFLVLLKCGTVRAESIMRGILADLREDCEKKDGLIWSFSYGIVDFSSSDSVNSAISMADRLMYKDKRSKYKHIKNNGELR